MSSGQCVQEILEDLFNFKQCDECEAVKETSGSYELFLKAVTVWINKPNVLNRRLCGAKVLSVHRMDSIEHLSLLLNGFANDYNPPCYQDQSFEFDDLSTETFLYTVITRELIPKSDHYTKVFEALIYDKTAKTVHIIPIGECERNSVGTKPYSTEEIPYSIQYRGLDTDECGSSSGSSNKIVMFWPCNHKEPELSKNRISARWHTSVVLERLLKWSTIPAISTSAKSLQLVGVERYNKIYLRLKDTYSQDLIQNWTESSDPKVPVFEDIAIAAYLMLIWEEDRQTKNLQHKQTFLDLGCGYGILVYVLTKEGYKGLGINPSKSKMWDTFGSDVNLQESPLSPSSDQLFPEYDWIIGNRSNELSPWIPVIASRSSYNCCFFLLPNRHYDFFGKFYVREKGQSRYGTYLAFIGDCITNSGFRGECDTLKIPSTKKISYVGRSRTYAECEEEMAERRRQEFIDSRKIQVVCGGKVVGLAPETKKPVAVTRQNDYGFSAQSDYTTSAEKRPSSSFCDHEMTEGSGGSEAYKYIYKKYKF